mmetsp:Transcript_75887/g.167496  ORF Transcript_75887/g.167496 Transcript_75887/m.167496 type:complete len:253 (+) Transcript_75887:87-845(+)
MELSSHLVGCLIVAGDRSTNLSRLHPVSPLWRTSQDCVDHRGHDEVSNWHLWSRLQIDMNICFLPHIHRICRIHILRFVQTEICRLLRSKNGLLLGKFLLSHLVSFDHVPALPTVRINPNDQSVNGHLPGKSGDTGQWRYHNDLFQDSSQLRCAGKVGVVEVQVGVIQPVGDFLDGVSVGVHVWTHKIDVGISDQQFSHVQGELLWALVPNFNVLGIQLLLGFLGCRMPQNCASTGVLNALANKEPRRAKSS